MGIPSFKWSDIPLKNHIKDTNNVVFDFGFLGIASLVVLGNPHAIFFVEEDIMQYSLETFAPKIENHSLFPEGINVSIVRILSRESLEIRTWERGVGLTLSCGTASCASVVVSYRNNFTKNTVTVKTLGGNLFVKLKKNNHIILKGTSQYECSGFFNIKNNYLDI